MTDTRDVILSESSYPVNAEQAERWLQFVKTKDYQEFVIAPLSELLASLGRMTLRAGKPLPPETYIIMGGIGSLADDLMFLPQSASHLSQVVQEFREENETATQTSKQ